MGSGLAQMNGGYPKWSDNRRGQKSAHKQTEAKGRAMDADHTANPNQRDDPKQRDLEPSRVRRDTGYLTTDQGSGSTTPTTR